MIIHKKFIFNSLLKQNLEKSKKEIANDVESIYNEEIMNLDFNNIKCPKCGCIGEYDVKGYYTRTIIINNYSIRIKIKRIKCNHCGKTHALLFMDFVPYFQLSSKDSETLFLNDFKSNVYSDDLLKSLRKRFESFIKRITVFAISIKESIESITTKLITIRNNSYLQIHRGLVLLHQSS